MPVAAFEPKFMKIGVLTAALQELTPREKRDPDPDLAIEEWVAFARELGADHIQLSAALHPTKADVPAEAMLDPVANTLDLRKPFDRERAKRVKAALKAHSVGLSDVGYFDNMLHDDPKIRRKKHEFMRRTMDAAVLLGVGRAVGETMAVLMATGHAVHIPGGLLDSVRTLTANIAAELGEAPAGSDHYRVLFLTGTLLFLITFVVNLAADFVVRGIRRK